MENGHFFGEVNDVYAGIVLLTSSFWIAVGAILYTYLRGNVMLPTREQEINSIAADGITDVLYAARLKKPDEPGYLSPEEADTLAKRIGNVLTVHDLLPKGTLPLKKRLQQKFVMDLPAEILATKPVIQVADSKPDKSLLGLLNGAVSK